MNDLRARFRDDIAEEERQFERASRAEPSDLAAPVLVGAEGGGEEEGENCAAGGTRRGSEAARGEGGGDPSSAGPPLTPPRSLRGRRRPTLTKAGSEARDAWGGALRVGVETAVVQDAIASPAAPTSVSGSGSDENESHGKGASEGGSARAGSEGGASASPLFVQASAQRGECPHTRTAGAPRRVPGSERRAGVHVGLPQLRALHRELMTLLRRSARRSAHGAREACCVGLDRRAFTELWRLAATRAGVDVGPSVPSQLFDAFSAADGPGDTPAADVREVLCGLVVLCPADRFEKLRFCFTVYDTDDSGSLEREELLDLMYAVFGLFFDSEVSEEVERFVASVFAHMDVDQDGCISMDEFREVALMQPLIFRFFSLASSRGQHPRARMLRSLVACGAPPERDRPPAGGGDPSSGGEAPLEPKAEALGSAVRGTRQFQAAERLASSGSEAGCEDAGRLVSGVGELVAYARDLETRLTESRCVPPPARRGRRLPQALTHRATQDCALRGGRRGVCAEGGAGRRARRVGREPQPPARRAAASGAEGW